MWGLTIQTFALVVIALSVIKLIVILIKPENWMGVVNFVYGKPMITTLVALVLGYVSLMTLLESGITFVQIFGVMFFLMMLMALTFAAYSKDAIALGRKWLKQNNVLKRAWVPVIVWVVLLIWAIKEIFM